MCIPTQRVFPSDAQVVRPNQNFYPSFQEQRRLQPQLSGGRPAPMNDGFSLTDNTASRGTVVAYDGQTREAYKEMVAGFEYTAKNYQEAYKEAARTGKPVVAIFGGFDGNNARQLVQETLPQAKTGAAKDAVYLYIDKDSCTDPKLKEYTDSQLAGGHNASIAIVFSVKPNEKGNLQPEPPNFTWQGGHSSMIASFNQAITDAQTKQESYKGKFNEAALESSAEQTGSTEKRFSDARQTITENIQHALNATDWRDAEKGYQAAIAAADKIKPEDLRAEAERISKALKIAQVNSPEFEQLNEAAKTLNMLEHAKASTRVDLGLACLRWSNDQTDAATQKQFREVGAKWIESAALRDPSIYSNSSFNELIEKTGIPADKLKELLPKLGEVGDAEERQNPFHLQFPDPYQQTYKLDTHNEGSQDADSRIPDTKPVEEQPAHSAPRRTSPPRDTGHEAPPQTVPRITPLDKSPAPEQVKKLIEEDEAKAVKSEQDFNKIIVDAAKKGVPVVVKIGSRSCIPCKQMAPMLRSTEEQLQDKAVVVRILTEQTPGLADSFGAGQGVPITKVIAPLATAPGQPARYQEIRSKSGYGAGAVGAQEFAQFLNDAMSAYEQQRGRAKK